ncbi:hypothetical protein BS47DRAFT_1341492 [Hydnum rufescens UP504]|uniref:Uncharacterized protein n=1 Tax=Hydnum rufescens UP504 TaxID=1448309 RepID=A0A9P6B1F6_9AGAM|nr:hypothetical protein BS47DRAFT_1341492 [Hydnum rufescens UP504]
MIYTDDLELGGDRIGVEGRFLRFLPLNHLALSLMRGLIIDGDMNVGGVHRKYGLEQGGIIVCRPDGYGQHIKSPAHTFLFGYTNALAAISIFMSFSRNRGPARRARVENVGTLFRRFLDIEQDPVSEQAVMRWV